jgi:hypothetical protein
MRAGPAREHGPARTAMGIETHVQHHEAAAAPPVGTPFM